MGRGHPHALVRIAHHYPQTAYAGLSKPLQVEWQYMHWVIEDVGEYFAPIKEALATVFIPALLGGSETEQLQSARDSIPNLSIPLAVE